MKTALNKGSRSCSRTELVEWPDYGLGDPGIGVLFPKGTKNRFLSKAGDHPFYSMGTEGIYLCGNAAGYLTFAELRVRGAIPPFLHTPSWRGE